MQFERFMKGETNDLKDIAGSDRKKAVDFLIADENEAIAGYDRAILLIENSDIPKKEEIAAKLKGIAKDELGHIEILKGIKEGL